MRGKILKFLLENNKEYISGEKMAQELDISRAAVWKHVDMLRKLGCEIESRPNRGYKLIHLPDAIAPEILRSMDISGVLKDRKIEYFETIGSTNDKAMSMAADGARHGTIVLAEYQERGKGRLSRHWYSKDREGIYLSIILRPDLGPQDAPKISLIAGVAVARTIAAQSKINVGVKWPNDILSGARKICGILTEMTAGPDRIQHVVCGIGVNVNQSSFPPELERIATSVRIQSGVQFSRSQLLLQILNEFFDIYNTYIETGDFVPIITEYTKLSVILNKPVEVQIGKTVERGKCIGFDREGAIVLELANGKRRRFVSGEVSIRGEGIYV